MMDREYLQIANDIINNEKYQKLKSEDHHGITRYEHSMRVAKRTYLLSKRLKLNYKEATRAALLHDYFFSDQTTTKNLKGAFRHPIFACKNANEMIKLSEKENNIIRSHMFPLAKEFPKSKEALIVGYADKSVAFYEFLKFKFNPFKRFRKNNS